MVGQALAVAACSGRSRLLAAIHASLRVRHCRSIACATVVLRERRSTRERCMVCLVAHAPRQQRTTNAAATTRPQRRHTCARNAVAGRELTCQAGAHHAPTVLEYLVFRAEVYAAGQPAAATTSAWYMLSQWQPWVSKHASRSVWSLPRAVSSPDRKPLPHTINAASTNTSHRRSTRRQHAHAGTRTSVSAQRSAS